MKQDSNFMKNFYNEIIQKQVDVDYGYSSSTDVCVRLVQNCKTYGSDYDECLTC